MPITTYPFIEPANYNFGPKIELAFGNSKLNNIETPTDYTEDFDDATGLTFNASLIEIVGSANAALSLNDTPGQDFTETFDSDAGFTYNPIKVEFPGSSVRQIDNLPSGGTSWATYINDINLNYGGGVLTGTPVNGAAIVGNRLDLTGATNKYVQYIATDNANIVQTGAVKFKYTPDYTTSPSITLCLYSSAQSLIASNNNLILLRHNTNGTILLVIRDSTGTNISSVTLGVWSPTSGTPYEFELNMDVTTGETRLFIDGTQFGATETGTGTRSSATGLFWIGTNQDLGDNSDGYYEDIVFFDTVQHTTNYTPGYTLAEARWVAANVVLPEMEYTGAGTLISFDVFTTTESGSPRYTIQIARSGNYLYWNGAAWVTSNSTYAQSNDYTTFSTNLATLPINGEIYGQFKISFDDSNIAVSSVSELTASLTTQAYSVINPTIDLDLAVTPTVTGESVTAWNSFTESVVTVGSDSISYTLSDDNGSTYKYWSGSAWVTSSGYLQSSTGSDVNLNIPTFPKTTDGLKVRVYLHSNNGTTTPSIGNLIINYDDFIYSTTNPTIGFITTIFMDGLEGFAETSTKQGSDEITYLLKKDGVPYYWSGTSWDVSDETYAQTTTAADIEINKASFTSVKLVLEIIGYIHSTDGSTTPLLDEVAVNFDYAGADPELCKIYIFLRDGNGTIPETVEACLKIITVPYVIENNAYSQKVIPYTYIPETGELNWEVQILATCSIKIKTFLTEIITIPDSESAEIGNLI